jgi:hypothetical protein
VLRSLFIFLSSMISLSTFSLARRSSLISFSRLEMKARETADFPDLTLDLRDSRERIDLLKTVY